MMTVYEYVQKMIDVFPRVAADAFAPQRMQTALAAYISANYGETNRKPVYPRTDGGKTLQLVSGKLFKAATVYNAEGNVSKYRRDGDMYIFSHAIDLEVIPYARIHELGGEIQKTAKMKRYFIYRGIQEMKKTGNEQMAGFWFGMASNNNPIKIPARPYIGPSVEKFNDEGLTRIVDLMYQKLAEAVNA